MYYNFRPLSYRRYVTLHCLDLRSKRNSRVKVFQNWSVCESITESNEYLHRVYFTGEMHVEIDLNIITERSME
jgi:hypothetical protein